MLETSNRSVLVISADTAVVETIVGNNTSNQQFTARESVQTALGEPALFENNAIIIFDIDSVGSEIDTAIDQALKLKQNDPTQVLMMVGQKETLNEILKSSIQPLVYRAFNKPVNANQIFLAFKSAHTLNAELIEKQAAGEDIMVVGPAENRASVDAISAQRKTNPAIYAAVGVLALAILGFVFFGGDSDEQSPAVVIDKPAEAPRQIEDLTTSTTQITNELNQLAESAVQEGRYVSPQGDNALEYYDRVLEIDPYDSTAYEGRKAIAESMRTRYEEQVAAAKFDDAAKTIEALQKIEPLNLENDKLSKNLGTAINEHVKKIQATGSAADIEKITADLERIDSKVAGSSSATEALKAEKALIARIDKSLDEGNLTPPQKGNAYSLVSDALKGNKISKANSKPRVKQLSSKLLALANESFESQDLEETAKLSALVKRLNVDRTGLASLNEKVTARKEEIAAAAAAAELAEAERKAAEAQTLADAKPEPPKVIPAKVISRAPPRYPSRALKNGTEGWVEVMFYVNTDGKPTNITVQDAQPKKTFDTAAVKSVEKWRFSPSRNQDSGEAVRSVPISTKVQFRLD